MPQSKGIVGQIREKLGWLTADRQAEARGRLEEADAAGLGEKDRGDDRSAAEAVDRAELEVRDEYGDLAPDARPD